MAKLITSSAIILKQSVDISLKHNPKGGMFLRAAMFLMDVNMQGAQVGLCACAHSAFCECIWVCARRPADSGTSAECLPFPWSFDVTRSRCDNEPCAPPQGEHPAVCPELCQHSDPSPLHTQSHAHALSINTTAEHPTSIQGCSTSTQGTDCGNT